MSIVQPLLARTIQEVQYGSNKAKLWTWCEVDGAIVNPDAGATVSIYTSSGGTTPISGTSATEDGSNSLYIDLNASDTSIWILDQDYSAEFTYVSSGYSYTNRVVFDIVRLPLIHRCPVRIDDLKNAHSAIDAKLSNASETDAHQRYIHRAWIDVLTWCRAQGFRPGLIVDPVVLYAPTLARALELFWIAHTDVPNGTADRFAERYGEEYKASLDKVVLKFDPSDSRATDTVRGPNQPTLLIGPDHNASGRFTSPRRSW